MLWARFWMLAASLARAWELEAGDGLAVSDWSWAARVASLVVLETSFCWRWRRRSAAARSSVVGVASSTWMGPVGPEGE